MNNRVTRVRLERSWSRNDGFVYVSGCVGIKDGQHRGNFFHNHRVLVHDWLYESVRRKDFAPRPREYVIFPADALKLKSKRLTVKVGTLVGAAREFGALTPSIADAVIVSALLSASDIDEMGFPFGIVVMHRSIAGWYQSVLCRNTASGDACGPPKELTLDRHLRQGRIVLQGGLGYLFRAPPAAKREINPHHLGL